MLSPLAATGQPSILLLMKRHFLFLLSFLLCHLTSLAQKWRFNKQPLHKDSVAKGIIAHYRSTPDHYNGHELLLLKNKTYRYYTYGEGCSGCFNYGKWKIVNSVLELTSDIDPADIPVKLIYRT